MPHIRVYRLQDETEFKYAQAITLLYESPISCDPQPLAHNVREHHSEFQPNLSRAMSRMTTQTFRTCVEEQTTLDKDEDDGEAIVTELRDYE